MCVCARVRAAHCHHLCLLNTHPTPPKKHPPTQTTTKQQQNNNKTTTKQQQNIDTYPRLQIENRIYCSRVFRKLHLEIATRQDGLHVLHAVFYPRYEFDAPILAFDVVVANGAVTLAVADACPLSPRLTLPRHYLQTMTELQALHLPGLEQRRKIPEWGAQIFSPLAVVFTPSGADELAGFVKYAIALTHAHLLVSRCCFS